MRQHLGWLALTLFGSGCSIFYSGGNIAAVQLDAPPPIDAPFDADPSMLMLTGASPSEIFEGQGDGGSRSAILVIHGANFVQGAQVTLTAPSTVKLEWDNSKIVIPANSDYLAIPVVARVDGSLGADVLIPITIQVTQPIAGGGMTSQMLAGKLSLHGLPELTSVVLDTSGTTNGKAAASQLLLLYSSVALSSPVTFYGTKTQRVAIRATASINVMNVNAQGSNGANVTGGLGGPGGCAGANNQGQAECNGGGKPGATPGFLGGVGSDGGGAGFASMGIMGASGAAPGTGGVPTGDIVITSYDDFQTIRANQASGGGGGGINGTLGNGGGGGGGGGGTVELTADGDVTVGAIDVSGGNGGTGSSGGTGGGGAGGVIVVRTGATLSTGALTAAGGAGRTPGTGGHGSEGRIRWDAPAGAAPASTPMAVRGPAFVMAPSILTTDTTLRLIGTPSVQFNVYTVDESGTNHAGQQGVAFGADAMATINPPVSVGFNRVCITLAGGHQGAPEADKCIDVAYLP
ncbi:MAG: hypothetical protein JWO36_1095 [Myxococcales bacterium]|nr:hypothetical protein [Myxococcales bacterium]